MTEPDAPSLDQLLASAGAPGDLAPRVAATLGEQAAARLAADPWLILSVPGVRPEAADGFARSVLGGTAGPQDPRRARAVLAWLLDRAALDGHTAQPADVLCSALGTLGFGDPAGALQAALEEGDMLAFSNAVEEEDEEGGGAGPAEEPGGASGLMISRERYAFAEEGVGEAIQRLLATPEPLGEDWERLDISGDRIHGELRDSVGAYGLTLVATAPGIAKTAQIAGFAEAAAAAGVPVAIIGGNAASARTLNRELGGTELTVLSVREYLASLGRGEAEAANANTETVPGPRGGAAGAGAAGAGAGAGAESSHADSPAAAADEPGRTGDTDAEAAETTSSDTAEPTAESDASANAATGADADAAPGAAAEPPAVEFADPQPGLVVVSAAHQIDAEDLAALLDAVPEGMRVLLAGDPAEPGPAGPGQPFRDLIETRSEALLAYTADGRVPRVRAADSEPHPLTDLRFSLREGELPPPENDPEKRLVIVPVRDASEAVARAVQLAADSIPRTFGMTPDDIQVVTIRATGDAGAETVTRALRERLGTEQVRALTAREAMGGTWPAAVVVLDGPSSGSLTRALVYGLCGLAERHLSIVHGAGSALPQAVANVPDRPRHTRLPAVLREL
ncbi:helix-hairpin-helix domain-containing protein [Catenulispora rubra]|uniref:helix-hairpin-helix domain-containing protein n=1 Tax=Catenulispora rubra TaxID=280293 RepID=UPI001892203A|nr:helix-hairpin-helix domain-containing protein [Catenulispora rubra]